MENRTQTIKRALANVFGNKNISVRKETGTASGWIRVEITVEDRQEAHQKGISEYARQIIKNTGVELYTYSDDMGTDHDCLLIELIEK